MRVQIFLPIKQVLKVLHDDFSTALFFTYKGFPLKKYFLGLNAQFENNFSVCFPALESRIIWIQVELIMKGVEFQQNLPIFRCATISCFLSKSVSQ